ncbi:tail fiber domain-containing protein [Flavobacterium sp. NRK F10]|uniref:tail fiber domain-containing protein n=1 Tax=Flavobacterium sp. NRK F10 TaxID=2954931 RepID=UPI0020919D08|nr:tail fiber domain-containing protein [Flavobacterium sp. NRK F10]MCO6174107.1 tail fiber domain-containing protein [Flavobacterium sp. NRK F10]
MKYFTLLLFYLLFITCGFAQVGINTTSPDASSALDISSTDKGILIPRMTEIQRVAIAAPATGLLVYQTNDEEGFWYYNGTSWTSLKGGEFKSTSEIVHNTTNTAVDDFVFGATQLDQDGNPDHYNKFFFNKEKAAFRAGQVGDNAWNNVNTGICSVAMGFNNLASGLGSTSFGVGNQASGGIATAIGEYSQATGYSSIALGANLIVSGNYAIGIGYDNDATNTNSIAIGNYSTANGEGAFAIGNNSLASGYYSTAIGSANISSGNLSIALGNSNTALSFGEMTLGLNATNYVPLSTTSFNSSDRLLSVGNGVNTSNRSNALTILKNGNSALGNHTPTARMDIEGAALGVIPLQLRGGNNNDVYNFNQVTFGWNNDDSYRHNIRTRHNGVGDEGNSIDFFVWDYGTDSSETIGTKHVMTIDGIGNGALGIATTAPNYTLEVNGDAAKPGGGTFIATSDSRLKQNINPYTKGLDEVLLINPVTYQYNKQSGFDTKPVYTGVIAQELKEIAPEMVGTFTKDNTEYYNVDTSALTFMLVNSIKKLSEENNAVKSTNEVLQKQLNLLERKNEELEKQYREMTIRLEKIEDLLSA